MKHERRIALFVFIISLLGLSVSIFAAPLEVPGKVVSIVDGNTVEFLSLQNEAFKLVLAGIDCPELNQDFGVEAKKQLERLVGGKEAVVVIEGKDRFGNRVGSIRLARGRDPRLELLEKGYAWAQEKGPNTEFESIMEEAKNKGIGLWKQENPLAPWTFRRQQSMLVAKAG